MANPPPRTISFDQLRKELASLVRGPVCSPADSIFAERIKTFNGKLIPRANIAVSPLDAEDVSTVVKFCRGYSLSPSVRAGGYGIAGWAVAGDVVIDMSLLRDIDIEPPQAAGDGDVDYTPIKDMPASGSKGKGRAPSKPSIAGQSTSNAGAERSQGSKRRREDDEDDTDVTQGPVDDAKLRNYDAASHQVAQFLRGPPLPVEDGETPRQPPTNRRRLHSPTADEQYVPQLRMPPLTSRRLGDSSGTSSNSAQGSASDTGSSSGTGIGSPMSRTGSGSTSATSPDESEYGTSGISGNVNAPPSSAARSTGASDPFGYMASSSPAASMVLPATYPTVRPFPGPSNSMLLPSYLPPTTFGRPMPASSSAFASNFSNVASPFSLSPTGLNNIAPPRPIHSHAYVTFGAGMRQKEVDMFVSENPLEGVSSVTGSVENGLVPYHVPTSAHPAGSAIMILAGFGFLSRLHGLSIDNLVEVEMVLADGKILIVNKEEDPELWWAIRGAGPAFGIATRYKAKAFPVPVCFAGNLIYRFHRATAASLIKHFRDCIKGAPRELYANVLLTAGPADKDSLVVIQFCYLGSKEDGLPYLQAISSWDGERCLLNEINEKSFLFQQDSVAQVLRGKAGRQWFLRSSLIHSLPDDTIHETVVRFADTPIGCTWIFELAGGAIADYDDTCLPKEQREATWTVAALHQWDMGIDDPRCIQTAEEVSLFRFDQTVGSQWMDKTIKPVSIGGPLPTFLARHELPSRTMASYGKNWDRLVALKRKYDPEGFFRNTFWPLDKDEKPVEETYNEPLSPAM
ncbi:hypothetical protein BDW22DRAFT_1412957 [Trametopsis cervina]|nr:hypothetical protein BDW22DRAFT_1412957 [Trametopsis cervina]